MNAGDLIVALESGRVFKIKYLLGNKVVVNNGVFDFPLSEGQYVPHTPLWEELL